MVIELLGKSLGDGDVGGEADDGDHHAAGKQTQHQARRWRGERRETRDRRGVADQLDIPPLLQVERPDEENVKDDEEELDRQRHLRTEALVEVFSDEEQDGGGDADDQSVVVVLRDDGRREEVLELT